MDIIIKIKVMGRISANYNYNHKRLIYCNRSIVLISKVTIEIQRQLRKRQTYLAWHKLTETSSQLLIASLTRVKQTENKEIHNNIFPVMSQEFIISSKS